MISYHSVAPDFKKPWAYQKDYKTAQFSNLIFLSNIITDWCWSSCIWNYGNRKEENFISADWCVLDFDGPDTPLALVKDVFQDTIHIIGTTKSNQKDKGGVVCDRFRLVVPFETPITDIHTYKHTMKKLVYKYDSDKACIDGARFFWPCVDIVSIEHDGYKESIFVPTKEEIEQKIKESEEIVRKDSGEKLSTYALNIINNGPPIPKPDAEHRGWNDIFFRCALELVRKGYKKEKIYTLLYSKIPRSPGIAVYTEREKNRQIDRAIALAQR